MQGHRIAAGLGSCKAIQLGHLRLVEPEEDAAPLVTGVQIKDEIVELLEARIPFLPLDDPCRRQLEDFHTVLSIGRRLR